MLVGDPKQAIYAFRGGDVHTYLAARRRAGDATCTPRRQLAGRRRRCSVPSTRVLDDAALGDAHIRYRPHHRGRPAGSVTRIRRAGEADAGAAAHRSPSDVAGLTLTPSSGVVQKDAALAFIADGPRRRRGRACCPRAPPDRRPRRGPAPASSCGDVAVLVRPQPGRRDRARRAAGGRRARRRQRQRQRVRHRGGPGTGSPCCGRSSSPAADPGRAQSRSRRFFGWTAAAGWPRPTTPAGTTSTTASTTGAGLLAAARGRRLLAQLDALNDLSPGCCRRGR